MNHSLKKKKKKEDIFQLHGEGGRELESSSKLNNTHFFPHYSLNYVKSQYIVSYNIHTVKANYNNSLQKCS